MTAAKTLTAEDRMLWTRVARTVTPAGGKSVPEEETEDAEALFEAAVETPSLLSSVPKPVTALPRHPGIDAPSMAKLAKGRTPIEARLDLHGLSQAEAHGLLLTFLHRAHARGLRHVLVITGKGSSSFGGEGILRRAVPLWFATPPFRGLVSAFESAARGHGGTGALYVRLKRQ